MFKVRLGSTHTVCGNSPWTHVHVELSLTVSLLQDVNCIPDTEAQAVLVPGLEVTDGWKQKKSQYLMLQHFSEASRNRLTYYNMTHTDHRYSTHALCSLTTCAHICGNRVISDIYAHEHINNIFIN